MIGCESRNSTTRRAQSRKPAAAGRAGPAPRCACGHAARALIAVDRLRARVQRSAVVRRSPPLSILNKPPVVTPRLICQPLKRTVFAPLLCSSPRCPRAPRGRRRFESSIAPSPQSGRHPEGDSVRTANASESNSRAVALGSVHRGGGSDKKRESRNILTSSAAPTSVICPASSRPPVCHRASLSPSHKR